MDTRDLKITRPCPVDLDVDRDARQFFCDHCQKDVHVLGNWPRAEAEAFIAANRGKSMCVSLRRDRDGELSYADSPGRQRAAELVPVTRLRRRWIPEAAAAAGVAAVLSACAPHQPLPGLNRPALEDEPPCAVPSVMVPDEPSQPQVKDDAIVGELAPPDTVIERGEKPAIVERHVIERGKMAVVEAPKPKSPAKPEQPVRPERADWDVVDGGIDF